MVKTSKLTKIIKSKKYRAPISLVIVGVVLILAGLYYYKDLNELNATGYPIPVLISILYDRLLLMGVVLFLVSIYLTWRKKG